MDKAMFDLWIEVLFESRIMDYSVLVMEDGAPYHQNVALLNEGII